MTIPKKNTVKGASASASAAGKGKATMAKPDFHFISRNPPWTYLKLRLIPQPGSTPPPPVDALSARTYLTSALLQFLGLTGTSISVDILKIQHGSPMPAANIHSVAAGQPLGPRRWDTVWIRVPREDAAAVIAALSSWIGSGGNGASTSIAWMVCGKANFLGALVSSSGAGLFAR
ncbi:hypothetical protein NUU61_001841 [Penicillium alfredii]|uniref:Ribonucleases P/MRP subunit Pop8-like domain-containing protein n=1 Tax=Penicillium alfredii TaxID=1506179 RepID=A0A9W9FQL6_9EURO|nr:uncharacterized protein NUU61_001841 [Penicillium alfredii]KAJ5104494.1 hypothetical protein NUU61_001841 [Penicillium alfredii]